MNCKKRFVWSVIFFVALLRVLAPSAFCKSSDINSQWIAQPIKIDGQLSDWPEGTSYFLEESEATVGICNDSARVYLLVSFRNADYARLIHMSGLTVWLDTQGKKKKNFMVRLTGGPTMEQIAALSGKSSDNSQKQAPSGTQGRSGQSEKKMENKLICFQKDYIEEKQIPMDGSQGPACAFGVDKGFFVYEFSVPLKESAVLSYGLGADPAKIIGLGLIWGEMDKKEMGENRPEGGGGMPPRGGGGGGMPPGGMGGPGGSGGPGGDPGGRSGGPGGGDMPEKQEVWLKAQLTGAPAK